MQACKAHSHTHTYTRMHAHKQAHFFRRQSRKHTELWGIEAQQCADIVLLHPYISYTMRALILPLPKFQARKNGLSTTIHNSYYSLFSVNRLKKRKEKRMYLLTRHELESLTDWLYTWMSERERVEQLRERVVKEWRLQRPLWWEMVVVIL